MKKIALLLLFVLTAGCSKIDSRYVGKWQGVEVPTETLTITADGGDYIVVGQERELLFRPITPFKVMGTMTKVGLVIHPATGESTLTYDPKTNSLVSQQNFSKSRYFRRIDL